LIKILKKQLFNPQVFLVILLSVLLVGFFIYAICWQTNLLYYLAGSLFVCLLFLIPLHLRFLQKKSELELKKQGYLEKMNLLEVDIEKERRVIDAYGKKIANYCELQGLIERLCLSLTIHDTSRTLLSEVNKLFGRQDITVILYLFHPKTGELGIASSQKWHMEINLKEKKGDIYDQWVVKTRKPLLIEDTKRDFRFDAEKDASQNRTFRSLMSTPLAVGPKALGILRADSEGEHFFTTEDLRLLITIADLGAVAVENAQFYERVEDLAVRDGLTGLFLRRHFLDRLSHEITRQLRRKKELSLLMFDLDEFKKYNDSYGHMAGDIVLRTMGMILAETFREPGSFVCRYGGEEFAVLLTDCSKEKALGLAEEARKKIEDQSIVLRRKKTSITVSVGVATFLRDAQIKEELIQQADLALYRAKKKGRNRVCGA
jgi:diguanylate cyclase (GGDEF)-like protein